MLGLGFRVRFRVWVEAFEVHVLGCARVLQEGGSC